MTITTTAFALGIRRKKDDSVLDVLFPNISFNTHDALLSLARTQLGDDLSNSGTAFVSQDTLKEILENAAPLLQEENYKAVIKAWQRLAETPLTRSYGSADLVFVALETLDAPISSPEEAYFKLHCLSQRLVKPHNLNLEGLFGILSNVAWSNKGPILPQDVDLERLKYQGTDSPLTVTHVDKFPYLVNYHTPTGVRIASGSQVRLGAYLGEGTTIMPAGYVNFNAGSDGQAMIEGRVSAGVFIGDKTDVGGGASIMGTLSGGNNHVISIGAKCLLGANAGTGISLGFGCTVAAGVYITAGTKVSLYNEKNEPINHDFKVTEEGKNVVKAWELSGKDNMLFYQDSQSGQVICKPNPKTISLNASLHSN